MTPAEPAKTLGEALRWGKWALGGGEDAGLEADVLLRSVAGVARETLYARPEMALSGILLARFAKAVKERAELGCPVAYLTGEKEFAGLRLVMRRGVFIPRPETEGLFELVAEWWKALPAKSRTGIIADPCCGSGAIGVALAHHLGVKVVCIDSDPAAVTLTALNAERCGVGRLVEARKGNFLDSLGSGAKQVRAIAANPPYVATKELDLLCRDIANFEPREALDGGGDGLAAIEELARGACRCLAPGGLLALEIGAEQEVRAYEILRGPDWREVRVERDLAARPRYAMAMRNRAS